MNIWKGETMFVNCAIYLAQNEMSGWQWVASRWNQ